MDQHTLEVENLFDDNSVSSLNLEREMYTQHPFLQAPPPVPQLAYWQRCARLLRALTVTAALPSQTYDLTLQVIDLTQGLSNAVAESITHRDLLALVAAVLHLRQAAQHSRAEEPTQSTSALTDEPSCRASTPR